MSFDIFLQDFAESPIDRSESVGRRILSPLLDAGSFNVVTADGSMAVYGATDVPLTNLMFNHVAGELAWNVIFEVALAGDWVVMPIGGPICVVSETMAESIPEALAELGVVMVGSGTELREAATG